MPDVVIPLIGTALAVIGSLLSVVGTLVNNLPPQRHFTAMKIWAWSNPMLAVWAIGYIAGIWNGSLSVGALLVMYSVFTITNWWGLRKYNTTI